MRSLSEDDRTLSAHRAFWGEARSEPAAEFAASDENGPTTDIKVTKPPLAGFSPGLYNFQPWVRGGNAKQAKAWRVLFMGLPSAPYALGEGTLTEQERLIAQASSLEPHAQWMLDRIAINSGSRAVDSAVGQ